MNNRQIDLSSKLRCLVGTVAIMSNCLLLAQPARIEGKVADGTPSRGVASPEIHYEVLSSRSVQLPEEKVTIRRVALPRLRQAGRPVPEVPSASHTLKLAEEETILVLLSAAVYQGKLTQLHGQTSTGQTFSAWTDLDFNYFSGLSGFRHGGRSYGMVLAVSDDTTMPADAVFPTRNGGFHFTQGRSAETQAVADAFTSLWMSEWKTLTAARKSREAAAKNAALQPPKPAAESVLTFWDKPSRPLTVAEKSERDKTGEVAP